MRLRRYISALFIIIMLTAFCASQDSLAYAEPVNTSGLSEEQIAQLALQAAQMKKQNDKVEETKTVDKAKEWAELGERLALVMTTVASKLGIAADEFLNSTTGQITMWLVLWYLVGKSAASVVVAAIICAIILWSFRFFHMTKKVKLGDGKIEYQRRFEFKSHDAEVGSVWAHAASFLSIIVMTMLLAFG